MGALDIPQLTPVLKARYDNEAPVLGYPECPWYAMVKKMTNFTGDPWNLAVENAYPAGLSNQFGNALANIQGTQYLRFALTRRRTYGLAEVTTEAIRAAKDGGAVVDVFANECDNVVKAMAMRTGIDIYRNGGGAVARIASGSGTATVVLDNAGDIYNLSLNQWVQVATTDGTSGAVNAGKAQITALDPDATAGASVTIAGTWAASFPGMSATAFIFPDGNFGSSLIGLAGWVPTTAPTAGDNFYGLDRSIYPAQLAGVRIVGNGPMEQTIISGLGRMALAGAKPDALYVNPFDESNYSASASTKVIYDRVTNIDKIPVDFQTFAIKGPRGPVQVFSDPYCPRGVAYALTSSDWSLRTLGTAGGLLNEGGSPGVYPNPVADSVLTRFGTYGALFCKAPSRSAVITW